MALRTPASGGDFELAPEGMHVARCFKIVDLGTHFNPAFAKEIHKVGVYFEMPKTLQKEGSNAGRPFIIKQDFTLSHHKKALLRITLENWYGKRFDTKALDAAGGFDLEKVLGRAGLLNIVHSEDGKYANITTVNPLPDGMVCPEQINESFVFSLQDFNPTRFAALSQKMQDFIAQSGEYIRMHSERVDAAPPPGGAFDDMADDIPF